jgi:hypothetical protein
MNANCNTKKETFDPAQVLNAAKSTLVAATAQISQKDAEKTVKQFARNPREATGRGEVIWSRDQQIYSNRSFSTSIPDEKDEFSDLFEGGVGDFKYLARRS